ncbi:MAG TPA: hypothetical protein VFY06_13280 [Verrucomicrobiae bacterium]|nr:hypothetical protein [Verrucomicrobiae bacterium]
MSQARALAKALGGELKPPELNWKHAIVQRLFGRPVAKKTRFTLPSEKARCVQGRERL